MKPDPDPLIEATWVRLEYTVANLELACRDIRDALRRRSWPMLSAGVQSALSASTAALRLLGRIDAVMEIDERVPNDTR